MLKNLPENARDVGSVPGLARPPGEGNGNPLKYSCLENPMDRRAWRATVYVVVKSQTRQNAHAKFSPLQQALTPESGWKRRHHMGPTVYQELLPTHSPARQEGGACRTHFTDEKSVTSGS